MATIELPSKDVAAFIDKSIKFAMDGVKQNRHEILAIYTEIPAEQLAVLSKQLQTVAYGEKWVGEHTADYSPEVFRKGQEALRHYFKEIGLSWERIDVQS